MIRYALVALLLAGPAQADPAWAQFFDAPGAQVERDAQGTREAVRLPGDVEILRQRDGEGWSYVGLDRSDQGAVGCVARILRDIKRVAVQCDGVLNAAQDRRLDVHLTRLAAFYERNAVPDVTAQGFLEAVTSGIAADPLLECSKITDDFRRFAEQMTNLVSEAVIDDLLSVERLPVPNPCL